ncbi:MAG: D-aminoacyl-tRNA deacylase [Vicingaceae bacterium]
MRVVIQRVKSSTVEIENKEYATIDKGLLLLVAFEETDTNMDFEWIINKVINLRIINDDEGKMNLSVNDIKGEILVVSQFTLYASTKKGNRPSYIKSAPPKIAEQLYNQFIESFKIKFPDIKTGVFGANMQVKLINDGPVTIIIDSKNKE